MAVERNHWKNLLTAAVLALSSFAFVGNGSTMEAALTNAAAKPHRSLRGTQAHQKQRAGEARGFSAVAGAFVQGNVLRDGNGDLLRDDPDPKSISPHLTMATSDAISQLDDVSIHFYIKGSGKQPYLDRSLHIADTWGKDAQDITFLIDDSNRNEAEEAFALRPWARATVVEGTVQQGEYKGSSVGRGDPMLPVAYAAQRLKTRAVFAEEMRNASPRATHHWVCYLDDDMIVNVTNLKIDFLEKQPACAPNCIIGDKCRIGGIQYTAGGWCMERSLVERAAALFQEKTDADLGWTSTDDVDFHKAVIKNGLGAEAMGSKSFFSELAWWKFRTKRQPYLKMLVGEFSEQVSPSLAVYHKDFGAASSK